MSALTVFLIVFGMDSGLVVFEHPTMESCQAEVERYSEGLNTKFHVFARCVEAGDFVGGSR